MSTRPFFLITMTLVLGSAGCLPSFGVNGDGGASSGGGTGGSNGGSTGGTNGGQPKNDAGVPILADMAVPPDMAIDPVLIFNTQVAPILTTTCAGCHNKMGGIGPGFLEPDPDILTTMLAYPGLIGPTPDTSRVYVKGAHEGPALSAVDKPIIGNWITLWNATRPAVLDGGASKPAVKPFVPIIGSNSIDLSVIDPSLAGQTVTFTAKMVGTTLELTNIMIGAAPKMGVHMVHPLWVSWDANMNPTPDPVDSFSNLDETVDNGASLRMGPGTLFLPDFSSTATLNVVFATIEAKAVAGDGGTGLLGCKSVATWTSDAKPQLTNNCASCHGGNNASATSAFPLSATTDTQNCANTLGEVNVTTPANGNLFAYPNPANPGNGHPFHFPDTATYTTFTDAVSMWITNEK
jgi:cytochrome c553